MHPDATEVVSSDQETPPQEDGESSSADTQTSAEEQTAAEKRSLRQLIRDDPEYNAEFQRELAKAINRRERAATRAAARSAVETGDNAAALNVAHAVAQEQDDEDEAGPLNPEWQAKLERVRPQLELIMDVDENGLAHDEWYIRVYEQYGKADIDKRLAEDPAAFVRWLRNETDKVRLKSLAPSLAQAAATDQQNARLRGAPAPLTGGAGGGAGLTIDRYNAMSPDERREYGKKNPQAINDMVARLG